MQLRRGRSFYKGEKLQEIMTEYPLATVGEATTECAARYQKLTRLEKRKYEILAEKDKERYQKALAEYMNKKKDPECGKAEPPVAKRRSSRPKAETVKEESLKPNFEAEDQETEKAIDGWSPQAVSVPSLEYEKMVDPNEYYVEEQAWKYHNPPLPPSKKDGTADQEPEGAQFMYVSAEELRPLPPPPPLPQPFPQTGHCQWSFDEDTRVVLADFRSSRGDVVLTLEDEQFLLTLYERDDITGED
jgi:hypothetical protein